VGDWLHDIVKADIYPPYVGDADLDACLHDIVKAGIYPPYMGDEDLDACLHDIVKAGIYPPYVGDAGCVTVCTSLSKLTYTLHTWRMQCG